MTKIYFASLNTLRWLFDGVTCSGGYFKQTSFLQCALNYDIIAKIDKYE